MNEHIIENADLDVNNQKASGFSHSFDTGIAEMVGIEAAILFNHLCYWLSYNKIKNFNQHEGRTWTYDSLETMAEHMPYFTARQIKYAISKLVDKGIIIKSNFNKDKFDHTSWYALKDESALKVSKKFYERTNLSDRSTKQNPSMENSDLSGIGQICPIDGTNLSHPHISTHTIHTHPKKTSLKVSDPEIGEEIASRSDACASPVKKNSISKKAKKEKKEFSSEVQELSQKMLDLLMKHSPVYRPPADLEGFHSAVEQMIERDRQEAFLLIKTFEWAVSDNEQSGTFKGWQSIVCTNNKGGKATNPAEIFRRHLSKIHSQMNSQPKRKFAPCSDKTRAMQAMEEMNKRAL